MPAESLSARYQAAAENDPAADPGRDRQEDHISILPCAKTKLAPCGRLGVVRGDDADAQAMGELVDEREVARDGEDPGVEARPAPTVDRSCCRDGCGSKSPMPILGRLCDGVEPSAGSSR